MPINQKSINSYILVIWNCPLSGSRLFSVELQKKDTTFEPETPKVSPIRAFPVTPLIQGKSTVPFFVNGLHLNILTIIFKEATKKLYFCKERMAYSEQVG